ncbi:GAF and ANTAR domain-containing protein [Cellulomonas fengjieae]|uniref:GAF and ANTAR domain-containing protein n=1 Tax=Cellulomonas fengjieae TaxID=2819978 RepID=A0ABS3SIA9_9CELL|nr:GAF and ANTAR domain-containing protein [Cellulomonas fengjieae]MBO3085480.1 GAF and ANTAR domain-containing protein [Cellulomonas fengjieae]QVI64473.1 GAF and ANTAR domain-containing protein [Cellulomonas fengjieae]
MKRSVVLGRLATSVAAGDADEPLATRLCRACVEILGADGGSITLAPTEPERLTVSATDRNSARMEDLQDVLGEGPGHEAYRDGHAVVANVDGSGDGRFPLFDELVRDITGPVTVWSIPMHPGGHTIGVVTLYRLLGPLAGDLEDAQFLADAVGAALLDDAAGEEAPFAGWSDRARVHQATGMVVVQLVVAPEDALALLRAHAFSEASTLDEVARAVTERRLTFADTTSGSDVDEALPDDSTGMDGS